MDPSLPTPPPELTEQPAVGGGNLVDSILQSIQSGSANVPGADGVPIDPSVASGFELLSPPAPLSEFAGARQAVLEEHIPRVERLARNVIAGIVRAYEPGIYPSRTADDVHALEEALAVLRAILHESGLGALPIDPSQLSSLTSQKGAQSPQKDASGALQPSLLMDEKLSSKRVEEVFARVQRRREAAGVALNVLAQKHQ